jgi:hypothetical protein
MQTKISPVVLYVYETCLYLILKVGLRLRISENGVLRGISGLTQRMEKINNEELHNITLHLILLR